MGVYYEIANLDRREVLKSPHAAKEFEWNHPRNTSSCVVLWALFRFWNGDRIEVINDAGAFDEHPATVENWPNVWKTIEADYIRAISERGFFFERGDCPHGFAWHMVGHCLECFPEVTR